MNQIDECIVTATIICSILAVCTCVSCIVKITKYINPETISCDTAGATRHIDFLVEELNEFHCLTQESCINAVALSTEHKKLLILRMQEIQYDLLNKS